MGRFHDENFTNKKIGDFMGFHGDFMVIYW